ncbi:MAG: hypothetical protein CMH57_08990 [Myxococcales bacterium]|nr:hypothetical protein [Myxococcales bacterium]
MNQPTERQHALQHKNDALHDAWQPAFAPSTDVGQMVQMRRASGLTGEAVMAYGGAVQLATDENAAADGADAEPEKMGPDEHEAVAILAVADRLGEMAEEYDGMGGSCAEAAGVAAGLLREQRAEWLAAIGGEGDWEQMAYEATNHAGDPNWVADSVFTFEVENEVWHTMYDRYGERLRGNLSVLEQKRAALKEILEAAKEAEELMSEVAFGLEVIGYLETIQATAELIAIGPTRGANMPDVANNGNTLINGSAGASGSALIQQMIDSGLVQKLSQRKLVNECIADGRPIRECAQLDANVETIAAEIKRLISEVERDGYKLWAMHKFGDWGEGKVLACE